MERHPSFALGDAGTGNTSYTGDESVSAAPWSLDYYRNKAREFQALLVAIDDGAQTAQAVIAADVDPQVTQDMQDWLDDYEARKTTLRITAEAINLGAQALNAAGGRFPVLSIPSGLGLAPLLPVAAIAAVATAAVLITWGWKALDGLHERLVNAQALDAVKNDPDKAAQLAQLILHNQAAVQEAKASAGIFGFAGFGSLLTWGAVLVGAYFVWKQLQQHKGRSDGDD